LAKHFLNTPIVYKLGTKCIRYIPAFLSYAFARVIADLSMKSHKSAVENISENFRRVFPDATAEELYMRTRQLFRNYSEYLVDYGRFSELDKETLLKKIVHFEGEDNLISALNLKKGLILLTAHLGNWELGGIFFSAYGLRVNVLTLQDEDLEIGSNRSRYRQKYGVNTITIGDSPLSSVSLVNALNNNEVVAMLIDRYNDEEDSVNISFFDREILIPRGPFILSRVTGSPVVVAFVVKESGEYKGIVERHFIVRHEDEDEAIGEKVVRIFEKYVVKYPDQWYDFR
jgi:lauroyl/myristoyl acyltransferase